MNISQADLAQTLETSSEEDLNDAPFGIVKMDNAGTVLFYNRYESTLAGISPGSAIGRNFFTEIAPCTNNFMVAQKYVDAAENNTAIDESIDYLFTYKLKPTPVALRMLRSPTSQWLCVLKK